MSTEITAQKNTETKKENAMIPVVRVGATLPPSPSTAGSEVVIVGWKNTLIPYSSNREDRNKKFVGEETPKKFKK